MEHAGKLNPSFSEEEQEMAEVLKPIIVGPPAYASPDPATNAGALVSIEEHPLAADLSPDYGETAVDTEAEIDHYATTLGTEDPLATLSEDREEWTNADWQKVAKHYGLAVGGGKQKVKERVEAHEADIEEAASLSAADWTSLVDESENPDDLSALRSRYDASGASYSTVAKAFDDKQAEFDAEQQ